MNKKTCDACAKVIYDEESFVSVSATRVYAKNYPQQWVDKEFCVSCWMKREQCCGKNQYQR